MLGALNTVHSALPRTALHNFAHAIRPNAQVVSTPRTHIPQMQVIAPEVMSHPQRELVISNAGAAFWANQALREERLHEEKSI